MFAELVSLAVPPRCAACRAPGTAVADVLCDGCRRALPWLARPRCPRCALPLPHRRLCPARDAPFDAAWSAVAYEGVARDAMRALKFAAARPLADVMAAQIAANAPPHLLPPDAVLVAVPAHPARRRSRGFDPAGLIARALVRRTGLPLHPVLRRRGASTRQLGAGRAERRAAGRLEFVVHGPATLAPTILLIDDVHTTGATLTACAQALRDAGMKSIIALTWARALDEKSLPPSVENDLWQAYHR